MGIQKIIGGNAIKQGTTISHVDAVGGIDSFASALSNGGVNNSGVIVDRMKVYRFYSGDSNGLQSTTTYTISTGADDGKASDLQSSASTNSTYDTSFSNSIALPFLGVQYDGDEVEYDYTAGYFRFNNIVAAQGATVQSAYLKLNKRGGNFTSGVDNDFYVAAYDEDNQAAPTIASHLNHSNYTTAEVTWNSATDTGNGTLRSAANGTVLSSPDIKTVIQEILDRSGWSSGNSIVLAFYVKAKVTYKTTHVRFENYDDSGDVPPQLEITI
tara:strand:+ start:408 stop:1217 length:810 start_codon:yes stop_codon:yes gene_type:complete